MSTKLDQLTIAEAREIAALFAREVPQVAARCATNHPYNIGKNYLIRTVTMIDAGKLVAVTDQELVLENASWIADTGRWADALKLCSFNEVEPFPEGRVIVGRAAVIDAVEIDTVPRSPK